MSTNTDNNSAELSPEKSWESKLTILPIELQQAPLEVQKNYILWHEMDEFIATHPSRYYEFKSLITNELVTIDCRGLNGRTQQLAKEKGASPKDIELISNQMDILKKYKGQKLSLYSKWFSWLKKQGDGVFDWRRAEIIEMFGRYMTNEEVKEKLTADGFDVTHLELVKFVTANKAAINKKKLDFINSTKDHFLATDAGRMESIAMLHGKFIKLFNDLYNTPNKSAAQRAELKALSSEIRALVEQARRELKGEEIKLTIDGRIDVTASLQASKTIHELSKQIPLHLIPIYLVAAKTNQNPNFILSSLVNSFYKNFNGFGRMDPNNTPPVTIDIIRNYDWNEIQLYHQNKQLNPESIETITEWEEVPFAAKEKIMTKREKLEALLKSARTSENTDNE